MADYIETAFDYLTCDDFGIFYSAEKKWIRKIRGFATKFPDKVSILDDSANGIRAKVPKEWLSVRPKMTRKFTEEQKAKAADRLRSMRGDN